jgi:hypothetical protein
MYFVLCDELLAFSKIGIPLEEALSAGEIKQMRNELATPEICPMDFDVTILGWLERIQLWGKITYYHKDPENFRGKRKVSKSQFVSRVGDESLYKQMGKWSIKKNKLTSCTLRRDYVGPTGRHYVEEFMVSIKLRKELR